MLVAADNKMTVPIEHLLAQAYLCDERVQKIACLATEWEGRPEYQSLIATEKEIVLAHSITLRARAAEVVRVCESLGLSGCTVELVRKRPFDVVVAIHRFLHGDTDED